MMGTAASHLHPAHLSENRPECLEAWRASPTKLGSRSFKKFGPVNERVDQRVRTFSFRARHLGSSACQIRWHFERQGGTDSAWM